MLLKKKKRIINKELIDEIRLMGCIVNNNQCLRSCIDVHHITTIGAGGGDTIENLVPLCRKCHQAIHYSGSKSMAKNSSSYKEYLVKIGREEKT